MRRPENASRPRARRRLTTERLETRKLLAGDVAMTNSENPYDVNGDEVVSAIDALGVINTLALMQGGAEGESAAGALMPDTNGDGRVTPTDALAVINDLAAEGSLPDGVETGDVEGLPPNVRELRVHQGDFTLVEFEGENVDVLVEVLDDGSVQISSNGLTENFVIDHPSSLKFRVDGHFNTLVMLNVRLSDDLIFDVDGNQNRLMLINSHIGDDLIYLGAEGVDRVILADSAVGDDFEFHGRKQTDEVAILDSVIGDDFFFYGHKGTDTLLADGVSIGDDAIVRLGRDNDIGALRDVQVRDVADVDAESGYDSAAIGNDNLSAGRSNVRGFEQEIDFDDVADHFDAIIADILDSVGLTTPS